MKIVISPAKTLDFDSTVPVKAYTQPQFLEEAERLNRALKSKSIKKLEGLMSISRALASINYERNQVRNVAHTTENSRQAAFAFKGEVYIGLDAYSLSESQIEDMQSRLRILSGLYGLLKPLDLVQPYRLEMGTSLKVGRKENLYQFWGDKIAKALKAEMQKEDVLLNLASQEYFGAVDTKKLNQRVVTPVFKDLVKGELKVVSFFAKKARGLMVRYILDRGIENVEEIKTFDYEGYVFDGNLSTENTLVFTR